MAPIALLMALAAQSIDVGGVPSNVPTANALSSNPAACSSPTFVTDLDADGTLTCTGITVPHAEMHNHENAVATSVDASGVWYHVLEGMEDGTMSTGWTRSGGTLSATSAVYGVYAVAASISFGGGANNVYDFALFLDDVESHQCHAERKLGAGGATDVGSTSINCIATIGAGADDVKIKVLDSTTPATDITARHFTLSLVRVSP